MAEKFFILDAYALIFRSYYAFINNPRYNSKGLNTSAIFGFVNTLDEILKKENPSHIAVCFDAPVPSFRKEIYPEYKANRDATPEDIIKSVPYIKKILEGFKIPILEIEGYEADDIAGSLAKKFSSDKFNIFLMTSDKDYLQLIDKNIAVYKPRTKKQGVQIIGEEEFKQNYGLKSPVQYIDVLAMAGDTADNVPGIPGVGEKTAIKLLQKFENVENIYANIDKLTPSQRKKFEENKDLLELSKKLVTIVTDIKLDYDDKYFERKDQDTQALNDLFKELEFRRTAARVVKQTSDYPSIFDLQGNQQQPASQNLTNKFKTIKDAHPFYNLIETEYELAELIETLSNSKEFAFDTETTSLNAVEADIVGISFCAEKNKAYYLHLPDDFDSAKEILQKFKNVFENEKILKIGQNIKYDLLILKKYGVEVRGEYFDTMIAHHLLYPDLKHNMDYLAESYLNYKTIHIDELIGKKGKSQKSMRDVPADLIRDYAAEDADITFQLKQIFAPQIKEQNLTKIFTEVEMPLIRVLTEMEYAGILLDVGFLASYRDELQQKLEEYEKKIYELAGVKFNISSTQQLGEVLFKRLKISDKPKLTKTKQFATGEEELLKYKDKHAIIHYILEYRSLKKLLSTYIEALPKLLNPKTGRIHTSFNQAVTVTGRLSSNNPNLQNIPIRTPEGRKIRKAFVPAENGIFIDADYSQVELRLMAHLSQDPVMLEAFNSGKDIHSQTASKIFKVPLEQVTKQMRYQAKTANFAMIYGSSAVGLSQNLGISRQEARKLIDGYFETYPKVREYMQKMIEEARQKGYVTTLMGRKRILKDINSRNSLLRSNAEHNAINTPIQGSAADIIKLAMIKIYEQLQAKGLKTKMLLQVHDELLFEVPENERETVMHLVKDTMENVVKLSVPLIVDISEGKNWEEAH